MSKIVSKMIFGLLLFQLPTMADAKDIRWKSELHSKGDYTIIDQSQDGPMLHVFRGKKNGLFVTDSYKGTQQKGKPVFSTYSDEDGNDVKWVRSDGFFVDYIPHNCKRTLGRCVFKQIDSAGKTENRERTTQATKSGFRFSTKVEGKFLYKGEIKLDEFGDAGDGWLSGYQGEQKFTLIKAHRKKTN